MAYPAEKMPDIGESQESKEEVKPPLRIMKKIESEPYSNYHKAKEAGLFEKGTIFEMCRNYGYPVFVVEKFDPENDEITVRLQDRDGRFGEEKILKLGYLAESMDFKKISQIDFDKNPDWLEQSWPTNIPENKLE